MKTDTVKRSGGLVVGIGLLVWLGWQIIGNTVADTSAVSDPHYSLRWRPDDSLALITLADKQLLAGGETQLTGDLARQALLSDPLEEGALRVLAMTAEQAGGSDEANRLMTLAAGRSLRDTRALVWLYDQRVRANKPAEALRYADAILRTRYDLGKYFAESLVTFASIAEARPALVKLLGEAPPWRQWFLTELAAKASQPTITYAVLSGLAATPNPPQDGDLKPFLDRLIGDKQYQLAFLTWMHFLPPALSRSVPFVFNGDFEVPISGLPFDWMIVPITGATTAIVDDGEQGHALRVVFADTRVPYAQVSKLLMLPPGSYELSGLVKADHLVNERGVVWRIFCVDGSQATLATSEAAVGTSAWHRFATKFDVPATGCDAQWLRLELAARFPIEEQVSGAVWYDKLAIRWATAADAEAASSAAR